jgi:hypothetical protein
MSDWQGVGHKAEYEEALATVNHLGSLGYSGVIQNLTTMYENSYNNNMDEGGNQFTPVELQPNNFFDDGVEWNTFSIGENEFSRYQHNSTSNYSSGTGAGLFWKKDTKESTEQKDYLHIQTAKLGVTFEYTRVHLDRSLWFDSFLLTSQAWWWAGATQSNPTVGGITFSDGVAPPNTKGTWQMIPTDAIFTRNLEITLSTTNLENNTEITTMKKSHRSGFWIFSTSNSSETTDSVATYDFSASGSTISAPQMQLLALFCELMPKEPNPQVSLLPEG